MPKRAPTQRRQIDDQIEKRSRNLGKVITKEANVFSFGSENIVHGDSDDQVSFAWRKRFFTWQHDPVHYTPDAHDFIRYATEEGGAFQSTIMRSSTGHLIDRNIPQFTNAVYSIEVKRKTAATIGDIVLRCRKSVRIEVDGFVVYDSGDNVPNARTRITLSLPAQRWTKINVFFYSSDPNTDNNFIEFLFDLHQHVDRSRSSVPQPPNDLVATQGTFPNEIQLTWDVPNDSQYEYFQIWYGNDVTTQDVLLSSTVPGEQREYIHAGIPEATHYWYKIRAITSDGDLTTFTDPVEGWTGQGGIANSLGIFTYPNEYAQTFGGAEGAQVAIETSGYFNNEQVYFGVTTEFELTVAPVTTISGADFTVPNSYVPLVINGTDEYQEDANTWVYSFDPSVFHNGRVWIKAAANAGQLTAEMYIVYDSNGPTYGFVLEADETLTSGDQEDLYTRKEIVYIISSGSTYVRDLLPPGSRFPDPIDGFRYTAGFHKIHFSNTNTLWEKFDYVHGPSYAWDLSLQGQEGVIGLRTVYAKLYDRAGNVSDTATDTIYYATGYIEDVTDFSATTYYDKFDLRWKAIERPDMAGYKLWRGLTTIDPAEGDPPYADIPNPLISGYIDQWEGVGGTVESGVDWYYWVKGYTNVGLESENFTEVGPLQLRSDYPRSDVAISFDRVENQFEFVFRSNSADNSDDQRRADKHHIYRMDLTENPPPSNTVDKLRFLYTINHHGDSTTRFTGHDVPPMAGRKYNYWSLAENAYGYLAPNYGVVDPDDGLSLNDGAPNAPVWSDANAYQSHHIIRLAWVGGSETDLSEYFLYRESGTVAGDPTANADQIAAIPYNNIEGDLTGTVMIWDDIRGNGNENSIQPNEDYTYWLKAFDTAGSGSDYSDPRTYTLLTDPPPVPQWVSGSCYAWFGYNHLTITGQADPAGLVQGYHIYRDTGTDSANAVLIGTIFDARVNGITNTYDDHDVDFGTEYHYWATSFNEYESDFSAILTGLGVVKPNYQTLFVNYLDNSSFERDTDENFNWKLGTSLVLTTSDAAFGRVYATVAGTEARMLMYSGYIFVDPSQEYTLSFYAREGPVDLELGLRAEVFWYSPHREEISTSVNDFVAGDIDADWARLDANFTAPSTATSAAFRIYSLFTSQEYDVDAFQWEVYDADESPRPYIDSRVISADMMAAHVIRGDMIVASSIEAIHISGETITADEIQVGSITLDRLETLPGSQVSYRVGDDDFSELVRNDPVNYLISSGQHTIYIPPGILRFDTLEYEIIGVVAGEGGAGHVLSVFIAEDNNDTYYAFYNNVTASGYITFTNNLPDVFESGQFLIWSFTNKETAAEGINAGYFTFNGPYSGPGVQIDGNQITAGEIHGKYIKADTLDADRIKSGRVGNILTNAAFGMYDPSDFLDGGVVGLVYRNVSNWRFARGGNFLPGSQSYAEFSVQTGTLYDTNNKEPAFVGFNLYGQDGVTLPAALAVKPYMPGGLPARTSNFYLESRRVAIATGVSYRLSTHFMVGETADGNNSSIYLGVKAWNVSGEEITDDGALGPNWLTPNEHGLSQPLDPVDCYYVTEISGGDFSGQTSEWLRTGFDLTITGAEVHTISVLLGTLNQNKTISNVPYYYFDGVMLENASGEDSEWNDGFTTIIDGGSIVTEIIRANHIESDSIESRHIQAEAIQAGMIDAEAISGGNMVAGTLTSISENLIRDGNFARFVTTSGIYHNSTGTITTEDFPLADWVAKLNPASGSADVRWWIDTGNKMFDRHGIMLSGTNFGQVGNTNLTQGRYGDYYNEDDDDWGIPILPNTVYTMGVWVYKHAGSRDCNAGIFVTEYEADGSSITTHTEGFGGDSGDDDTWNFVSETFTTDSNAAKCVIGVRNFNSVGSAPALMVTFDGARLVQGHELPTGYMADGQTFINGGYIRTGTIDAEVVRIATSGSQVVMNASGITVGTAGSDQTLISDRDIKYVHDDITYRYPKRVDIYERIPLNATYTFPKAYIAEPKIMIAPSMEIQTFDVVLTTTKDQHLTLRPEEITNTSFKPMGYLTTGTAMDINSWDGNDGDFNWTDPDIGTEAADKWISGTITSWTSKWVAFLNSSADEANSAEATVQITINNLTTDPAHAKYYTGSWWELQFLVGEKSGSSLVGGTIQTATVSGYVNPSTGEGEGVSVLRTLNIEGLDDTKNYGVLLIFYELGGGSNAITDGTIEYTEFLSDVLKFEKFDPANNGITLNKGWVRVLAIEDNQVE